MSGSLPYSPVSPVSPIAPSLPWARRGARPAAGLAGETPAEQAGALRRVDRRLARMPLIAATYLSKIGIPGLGALALSFSIPFLYLALAIGLVSGRFVVAGKRLLAFMLLASVLWLMQALRDLPFSPASLLMVCVLHFPYVFALRTAGDRRLQTWHGLRTVCTVIAVCAIAQYGLQFLVGQKLAFPLDNFLPESMKVLGYNNQGWIEYGSSIIRANGIFMLEPSFLSQLLAVGIVGELCYGHTSRAHIALYAVALLVSYSGTGLLALAACLPVWVVMRRQTIWAAAAVFVLLLFLALLASGVAADNPFVKVFVERSTEFTSKGSSGFARFVGGFYMFEQFLWPDIWRALFGFGAGSFLPYSELANYAAHGMAVFKMVFEYGLIGATLYFGFIFYCLASSSAPLLMRIVVFVPLLIQNFSPFAQGLFIALLMWNTPEPAGLAKEPSWA